VQSSTADMHERPSVSFFGLQVACAHMPRCFAELRRAFWFKDMHRRGASVLF
jgi:hypothetical protein